MILIKENKEFALKHIDYDLLQVIIMKTQETR